MFYVFSCNDIGRNPKQFTFNFLFKVIKNRGSRIKITTEQTNDSKQEEKENPRRTAERFHPLEAHAWGLLVPRTL